MELCDLALLGDEPKICIEATSIGVEAVCVAENGLRFEHLVQLMKLFNPEHDEEMLQAPDEVGFRDIVREKKDSEEIMNRVKNECDKEEEERIVDQIRKEVEKPVIESSAVEVDTLVKQEREIVEGVAARGQIIKDESPGKGWTCGSDGDGIGCRVTVAGTAPKRPREPQLLDLSRN